MGGVSGVGFAKALTGQQEQKIIAEQMGSNLVAPRGLFAFLILTLASALLVSPGMVSLGDAASSRIYTIDARGEPLYKPHSLNFGANGLLHKNRWTSWGGTRARGRGIFPFNDCTPDCARGHVTSYRVRLILSRVVTCKDRPTYVHLTYIYLHGHKPAGIQSRTRVDLAREGAC